LTASYQPLQREDADRRLGGPRKRLQQLEQQLQNCYSSAQQQPLEVQKEQQQQQLSVLLSDYVPRALLEELREASISSSDNNDYSSSSEDIGGRAVTMLATALRVHVTGKLDSI
jgi:hypothetical protein